MARKVTVKALKSYLWIDTLKQEAYKCFMVIHIKQERRNLWAKKYHQYTLVNYILP